MARDEADERRKPRPPSPPPRNDQFLTGWSATLVALFIGAAVVGNIISLRRRLANFHRFGEGNSARSGARGRQNSSYQEPGGPSHYYRVDEEEARRIWAAHLKEMERLRRRQEAFDRERMRFKQNYDSWQERHGDKWDWRWHGNRWEWQGESERIWYEESADDWRRESQRTKARAEPSRAAVDNYQHYLALGLNPAQSRSYTEADVKAAFRAKALEFHPDTNQHNKAEAEKKFHQVMEAYNALRAAKAKAK